MVAFLNEGPLEATLFHASGQVQPESRKLLRAGVEPIQDWEANKLLLER